jgi:hypothetical protein
VIVTGRIPSRQLVIEGLATQVAEQENQAGRCEMKLTMEEREAVERGDLVKFMIPESRVECVVVREDLLDPLRVRADFSPCDPDELSARTAEIMDDEDWTMPAGHPTP